MHPGQMRQRCPGCVLVGAATLRDYRLVFSRPFAAWDGRGVADIEAWPAGLVEGVLWDITEADRDALDAYEQYPTEYTRAEVSVATTSGRTVAAFAYVARPLGTFRPGRRYRDALVEGARAHGLSPEYIRFLEMIPTED
jgi:cation transport regulator ChaC